MSVSESRLIDIASSIKFYDDLIISKAADEDKILLWKIDGFSTMNDDVQPEYVAPIVTCTDSSTKSAFGGKFQRLLIRSEEHTSELQSQSNLVCRLLLEKKNNKS